MAVGAEVGPVVGDEDPLEVGPVDGPVVGDEDPLEVGTDVGAVVGPAVDPADGDVDGAVVGLPDPPGPPVPDGPGPVEPPDPLVNGTTPVVVPPVPLQALKPARRKKSKNADERMRFIQAPREKLVCRMD